MWMLPALAALSGASYSALAQQLSSTTTELAGSASTDSVAAPGDITVTAQRREERLRDVPLSIVALTGQDLSRSGVSSVKDLNISVPGVNFTTLAGYAQPVIRGVSTGVNQAAADPPTALYLDGLYQTNKLANLFDLPDIERIEVLKGPQGTLFGRNAVAGAVSIYTRRPTYETTGQVSVNAGLYDGARTSSNVVLKGYVSTPLVADKVALSVSGFYEYTEGYLQDEVRDVRAGRVKKYLVRAKLLVEPTENLSFMLTGLAGHVSDFVSGASTPLNGNSLAAFYPDGIVTSVPWHVAGELRNPPNAIRNRIRAASLKAELDLPDVGTISSLTGYTDTHASAESDIDAGYSPTCYATYQCVIFNVTANDSETFQQEVNFASDKFGAFSFVAGAFYYLDKSRFAGDIFPGVTADGEIEPSITPLVSLDTRVKTTAVAGFGEVNLDVSDRLHVIAGMRYSWEKQEGLGTPAAGILPPRAYPNGGKASADAWTPRVSVRYDISPQVNIYATYSKGFKSVVVDSVQSSDSTADPERLTAYEIGTKIGTRNFSLNAAAFLYDYKDLQVLFFDGVTSTLTNAASAKIIGVEADANIRLTEGFSLKLAGSWLPRARYEQFPGGEAFALPNGPSGMVRVPVDASGDRLLRAPRFTGSTTISYAGDVGSGRLDASATMYYSSTFDWDLLRRVQTKRYAQLNGIIGYSPSSMPVRFSIFGKNLTNKASISGALLTAGADGVSYTAPRLIGVGAEISF